MIMNTSVKLYVVALLLLVCSSAVSAQTFLYNVEALSYFDNREYKNEYVHSRTLFGFRLSPEVGVGFSDKADGHHRLMGGVHYNQPIGNNLKSAYFTPTIYYEYARKRLTMSLGAVPFTHMKQSLPDYLQYDSLTYMRPNIQGALIQYQAPKFTGEVFCDWRSIQTETQREAFRIVLMAQYHPGMFYFGGNLQINHLASTTIIKQGVCDDIMVNPFVGLDFTRLLPLDSLSLQVGYILAYAWDRVREENPSFPGGIHVDLTARWKRLGLHNTLYAGKNIMPLYNSVGALLYQGDPLYQDPFHDRLDIYFCIVRHPAVSCYFSWNFHFLSSAKRLNHQQQLTVCFNLDALHNTQNLKNLFGK